jgi:hypothetical protein
MSKEDGQGNSLDSLRRVLGSQSMGYTPTERNLALLTTQTFFSLWCYPNLYKEPGKELCDLVIFFGDDVVLFSDKNIAYPEHADPNVAWVRWYRRAVLASADQLFGAESSIRRFPSKIFLDSACTTSFPLPLSDMSKARFHRVAIANGSREACKSLTKSRFGSLKISSELEADAHLDTPFAIGRIRPDKPFVHVLDSESLAFVLSELDTMKDFIGYLRQKETLFESRRRISAAGEEQLLAHYLNEENRFDVTGDIELAGEDHFTQLAQSKEYIARKRANEVSYLFDVFVEQTIWHAKEPVFLAGTDLRVELFEKAIRVIAQESRFKRRLLGEVFVSLRTTKWDRPTARYAYLKEEPDNVYVFTVEPNRGVRAPVKLDETPRGFLYVSCFRAPAVAPGAKHVVGFDVGEAGPSAAGTLFYMDMTDAYIVSMIKRFEKDFPPDARGRRTEQKVGQDVGFKEPRRGGFRKDGWKPVKR